MHSDAASQSGGWWQGGGAAYKYIVPRPDGGTPASRKPLKYSNGAVDGTPGSETFMRGGGFRASTAGGRGGGGGAGAAKVGWQDDIVAARGRCAQVFARSVCAQTCASASTTA